MSNLAAINQFEEKVKSILDTDVGDFKRKAQTYLNRLKGELKTNSKEVVVLVRKADQLLSFDYEQDIDEVQIHLQQIVGEMRSQLGS